MVFLSCFIIRAGGLDFVFEAAEEDSFSVDLDTGAPFFVFFAPSNALVSGM